jgi:RNA polymerase sigma-70 factor, ECF subfamily
LSDTRWSDDLGSLIQRCNCGDRSAWEEFYARCLPQVRCAVAKVFRSRSEEIEDVVQDVFIHLFRALHQYEASRSIEAYILEIARRVGISRFRHNSALKRGGLNPGRVSIDGNDSESDAGWVFLTAQAETQEDALIRAQETSYLRRALGRLSESCRKLLALRYDGGLSYGDIAVELNVKEGTLRVRVQRCLSSLSAAYAEVSLKEVSHT